MNNSFFSGKSRYWAFALALPLFASRPLCAQRSHPLTAVTQSENSPRNPLSVTAVTRLNPTTVEIHFANRQMMTVDFYGDNIFRIFQNNNGGYMQPPKANPPAQILVENPRKKVTSLNILKGSGEYLIRTPKVELFINENNGLFYVVNKQSGVVVLKEKAPVKFEQNSTTLRLAAQPQEYFYGGGVQNGRFSHRGTSIAIENTNNWVNGGVASPAPFYWSTMGYGLMWYTFKPGRYDFCANGQNEADIKHNTNYLDVFVMVNSRPQDLLKDYYQLTGNPVLLPKFGFYEGHLNAYNRDYWKEAKNGFMLFEDGKRYNESQKNNGGIHESLNGEKNNYQFSARAAIDRYVRNDMPLGWFLPNDGYGAGYGQTGTLDGNIQNLKAFGDYARSKGVQIGLWTQSDLHPKKGVEALLQRDIIKEVRDAGVRVLKTDVAWVGAGYSFGLNGVADVSKVMPYYGNNARPFIITLDGWAGTQRYAGVWTGDQTGGDWEYIRFHIPTFIGSGLSGQPNITDDLDGIFGGKNLPVNVRDFQWKTFTPMELNMDGWGLTPKYPMILGEPATSINRSYLKLKSELLSYTYTFAHEACSGKPLVRALFMDYPNAYTYGDKTKYEFLYGDNFLVAPIYKETQADKQGNDIRDGIYLPEGKWIDFFNGQVYEGNRIINNFDAPLWKLPVFVKSGAIIPMTNPNNNPSQIRKDYRLYEFYPDGNSSLRQYDDDGATEAYLQGQSAETPVYCKQKKDKVFIQIDKTQGDFQGFVPEKETELKVNMTRAPKAVKARVAGKKVSLKEAASLQEYNEGNNVYFYETAPNLNRFATKGSAFAKVKIIKNPQLLIKIAKCNVKKQDISVEIKGFAYQPASNLLKHVGKLSAPQARITPKHIGAYELTPSWTPVPNADYYEILFQGNLYSTIRNTFLTLDGLTPMTQYSIEVRAVNKTGKSPWTTLTESTHQDPYRDAIKGILGQTTCANQPGQGISKLFDFEEKTIWHSKWQAKAVPFDMTLDLNALYDLDKLEYHPREDAGNGTILKGSISYSADRQKWSEPVPFVWKRNGEHKFFLFAGKPLARYVKIHVDEAVGDFGSGQELYIFKVPGTEGILQGDINKDKHIDENDLTSYMNYTGLRKGDADFDYVSYGDVNKNGLIDAYDISTVSTRLDGGVTPSARDHAAGRLLLTPSKLSFAAGDEVDILVTGKNFHSVNGLSFALPYDASELKYEGLKLLNMKDMVNLTYDRLHSNGQKELFPTFVNRGPNFLLEDGNLFIIKFRAKKAGKYDLKATDGILVDRSLGTCNPLK